MFQGFCDLGDTFNGLTLAESAYGRAAAADSLPTARVYSQAGYLMNATVSAFDAANITGAYQWSIVASGPNGFLAGQTYFVVFNYLISAVAYSKVESFAVA